MEKIIKEFERLAGLLNKYAHRVGENTSTRMYSWLDRYDEMIEENPTAFKAYCEKHGYSTDHKSFDCLA